MTGQLRFDWGLPRKLRSRLDEINRSMSTYIEDSEISRFNRYEQADTPFAVSNDFLQVMQAGA